MTSGESLTIVIVDGEMPVTEGIQDFFMAFEYVVAISLAFFVFGFASEINNAILVMS